MASILISGASIAGPTLAFWLHRFGHEVTIVERADSLRLGGQNIDVKGAAVQVAEKMGIRDAVERANTTEKGIQFVDRNNRVAGAFAAGDAGGLTTELEILRGDLVSILYEHTRDNVRYEFGRHITGLRDGEAGMDVTFSDGGTQTYDLVVAADGVHSATRDLVFGDEVKMKYLGLYTSYLTIPKGPTDTEWARWYTATKSRMILLRPDNKGTTRASFNFLTPDKGYSRLPMAAQQALLERVFADAGWEAPRVLAGMRQSDDLYLDATTQVKAPCWSRGRFVMVGDAAYCPTPISGQGTALAMIGAYVLGNELGATGDYQSAFAAYEKKLRPYVESVQKLPPGVPKLVYPATRVGVGILNTVVKVAASSPVQRLAKWFDNHKKADPDAFRLPVYPSSGRDFRNSEEGR